jgi:hypothetical protein
MHKLLLGLGGFAAGAVAVVAIGQTNDPSPHSASPVPMYAPSAMTQGSGMMGSTTVGGTNVELRIAHVLRGCHVWNDGRRRAATMRLSMPRGGRLTVLDQDLDPHQLVELKGPRLRMPAPMAMMGTGRLRFMRPGVYRLATKTVELPGQSMPEATTVGPDNQLRLVVTVT